MTQEDVTNPFESTTTIAPEVRALSDRVKEQFIVSFELSSRHTKEISDLIQRLPEHLQAAPQSFLSALTAISDAACLPNRISFGLAWENERSRVLLHAIHTINGKGLLPNESQEEASDRVIKQAHAAADEEMRTITQSEARFNRVFRQSIEALLFDPFQQSTVQAAKELRYQTAVAIWSSIEVLLKDQLIEIINWKPELAKRLITDEVAKKRFELPKLTFDELEERKFNFQNCMGDLLVRQRDASDLLTLKAAVGAIWGKGDLFNILESREIRLLNLQRHLIVHRRGIVDEKYLSQSGDQAQKGEPVAIPPSSIVNFYRVAAKVGKIACEAFLALCNPIPGLPIDQNDSPKKQYNTNISV
ncbi:hypothetical protein [Comamonas fluminis]|uniref:hypothetical protein n=1 Tax=Comamonas fluminis TaxID=2796366 RepID=UPI001C477B34|nr:hypothetical protein [Comamonas fluminis]